MSTLAELFVWIKGDDSQLEKSLSGAEQKTESASASMAKALGGAIVGAAAVAGAAVLAIGTKAFSVATDIDAATDQIGASLGLTEDKAKEFGDVIKAVYGDNWGDSIADVGDAVEQVAKQLNLAANDPSLPKVTANAFRLRDVFKVDVASSVNAAKTLMQNFGITSDQAFDMLATGYQRGLDSSGDFLDTIGEYSVQFAEGGASAVEFFSALDSGLQGGMLGTDKAADAFKEFRLRIQDGSQLTKDSLAAIGLNADEITSKLKSGSITIVDAWDLVQKGMFNTVDPLARFNAGVGLIGSQFEDLGEKAIMAIDITEDWADGGLQSISEMDTKYTSLGGVIEGMWRKFEVGIAPAGEAMLGFVNENLPAIQGVVNSVSGAIVTLVGLIPLAMAGARKAWDEDWAGIRTTWDLFAAEMPGKQEKFWEEWNEAFNDGSGENAKNWEEFFKNLFGGFGRWAVTSFDLLTLFLGNWNNTTDAFHALTIGDWQTFWTKIGENFTNWFDWLLDAIDIFDMGFKERWLGLWNSLLGGDGAVVTPDMGVVNPENTKPAWEKIPIIAPGAQSAMGGFGSTTNRNIVVEAGGITITGVGTSPEGLAYLEDALTSLLERATQ